MLLNYYVEMTGFLMLWTNSQIASEQEYRREGGETEEELPNQNRNNLQKKSHGNKLWKQQSQLPNPEVQLQLYFLKEKDKILAEALCST